MRAYLEATRAGNYEKGAEYLDLRRIAPERRQEAGPRLAREIKVVLDQQLWVDLESLSAEPGGDPEDELPSYRDRVGRIETAAGPVQILMDRVPGTSGERVWKFSRPTVSAIPGLYEEFGYGPLGEYLPEAFFTIRFLAVELWQWVGLLALLVLSWVIGTLAEMLFLRGARRIVTRTATRIDDRLLDVVASPLIVTLTAAVFYAGSFALRLSLPAQRVVGGLLRVILIASATWVAVRVVEVVARSFDEVAIARGEPAARTMIQMGSRLTKALLIGVAVLGGLHAMGYNVTAVLAGLGIGGLAVALAAQKTFENFFGGLSVLVDRPVQVGNFCRYGEKVGIVEEIGLRSTRIRSLDRTIVTVPNSEFSSLQLENFSARDRIRFFAMLGLRYETTAEQMRWILVELKRLLLAHPKVHPDPARIRFVGFGAYSLDLELFSYIRTTDWDEFLAIREDLMLLIMDVVEKSGSGFAFPSQTLYVGKDDGLDAERSRGAESQVEEWRTRGELCLPDWPHSRAREVDDSLPYPPKGSAVAGRV
jgi:MscS family membrane protein